MSRYMKISIGCELNYQLLQALIRTPRFSLLSHNLQCCTIPSARLQHLVEQDLTLAGTSPLLVRGPNWKWLTTFELALSSLWQVLQPLYPSLKYITEIFDEPNCIIA
jgi:hypothetical protein